MSLSTYSDLVSAIGDWLDRDDLETRAPDFIRLAEVRLNRLLSDPDMETTTTLTATSEYTALPADFGEMVSISADGDPLKVLSAAEYAGTDHTITGEARWYAIVDGQIAFVPLDTAAVIRLVYRQSIPALTASAASNWLLTRAPDVYLYGSLVQAEAFLAEDDRLALWKSAFDEAVSELRIDAARRKWGAGPIAARIRRT